jgi:hypothetical protein
VVENQTKQDIAATMQQDQNEELAGLFARTMNISNMTPPPEDAPNAPKDNQPITYASTHYTHSHHVASSRFGNNARPAQLVPSDEQLANMLMQNGIDPHSLFPAQIDLVRKADDEQRLRLLELWRISPPALGSYDLIKEHQSWNETTVQKEEEMARLKYERLNERRTSVHHSRSSSGNNVIAPAVQEAAMMESAAPDRPASAPGSRSTTAEPYMVSGYEMLARRDYDDPNYVPLRETTRYNQATDPVFKGSGLWHNASPENVENSWGILDARPLGHFVTPEDQDMAM